ncbi:MAG: hypothetical protein J5J00_04980 [Deltaproteobacteria bacterium]|nr:hypothetical protein [Deltaproteobacteria bacterium]
MSRALCITLFVSFMAACSPAAKVPVFGVGHPANPDAATGKMDANFSALQDSLSQPAVLRSEARDANKLKHMGHRH